MRELLLLIFTILSVLPNLTYGSPKTGLAELMILSENNPQLVKTAEAEAMRQNLPLSIFTSDKVLYSVKLLENGRPVYSVFKDINNPYNGGYTAFYEEFKNKQQPKRLCLNGYCFGSCFVDVDVNRSVHSIV